MNKKKLREALILLPTNVFWVAVLEKAAAFRASNALKLLMGTDAKKLSHYLSKNIKFGK